MIHALDLDTNYAWTYSLLINPLTLFTNVPNAIPNRQSNLHTHLHLALCFARTQLSCSLGLDSHLALITLFALAPPTRSCYTSRI